MAEETSGQGVRPSGAECFVTTHWSVVEAAGHARAGDSRAALEQLCQTYWYPLYAYVRRRGNSPEDAQDLTQAFFLRLLEQQSIALADRTRGKFRTFLLSALKNFLINQHEKASTAKRGGGQLHFSINAERAEGRYESEPVDDLTPDKLFEQRWATIVIEEALQKLRFEYAAEGQQPLFESLKESLWGDCRMSYTEMARPFGMNEGAMRAAAFRLRKRLGQILRGLIADTVAEPSQVEEELKSLLDSFGR